jgi:hypothetical protein
MLEPFKIKVVSRAVSLTLRDIISFPSGYHLVLYKWRHCIHIAIINLIPCINLLSHESFTLKFFQCTMKKSVSTVNMFHTQDPYLPVTKKRHHIHFLLLISKRERFISHVKLVFYCIDCKVSLYHSSSINGKFERQ